jgi:hypothetical protein
MSVLASRLEANNPTLSRDALQKATHLVIEKLDRYLPCFASRH